jgi:hypothetical protein
MRVGPELQDIEVVANYRALERGLWSAHEVEGIKRQISDRQQRLLAGLRDTTAEYWTRKLRAEVEDKLRMRNDPFDGFVIDRWTGEYWQQIPGKIGKAHIRPGLCDRMRGEYDMQRVSSPAQDAEAISGAIRHPYLVQKDQESGQVRKENEQKATDKVLAAVDSLSEKQVQNFVAVEQARHTGEKLVHHGPDLKFVEHVAEAEKTSPSIPEDMGEYCGNPGMNPRVYKRAKGGKHIRE